MEPIQTTLEYIRYLPKYENERPYQIFVDDVQVSKYQPDDPRLNTVELQEKPTKIYDLRTLEDLTMNKYGFQALPCNFTPFSLANVTLPDVEVYQDETEKMLSECFGAELVISYDYRVRLPFSVAVPKFD
jgi:hypothetical protein